MPSLTHDPPQTDPDLRDYAQQTFSAEDEQWVENVPLVPYHDEKEFWAVYEAKYCRIMKRAKEFLERTDAKMGEVFVFLRCVLRFSFPSSEEPTSDDAIFWC